MAVPPNLINATVINGASTILGKGLSDPAIIKENPKDSGKLFKINVLKLFKLPCPGEVLPDAFMEFYIDNAGITNATTLKSNANCIWKRKYIEIDPYFRTSVEYVISKESVIYLPEGKSLYLIQNGVIGGKHYSITLSYEEIS
jgi:hypothetical protein